MRLTDAEILLEIETGRLVFDPSIHVASSREMKSQIGRSSIDLRLGKKFREWKQNPESPESVLRARIDPLQIREEQDWHRLQEEYTQSVEYDPREGFVLRPHQFVLGETLERVQLPNYLAAWVEGRSSLGRLGLMVHSTAPALHAGWKGRIVLELYLHAEHELILSPEELRICQLILEKASRPPQGREIGIFNDQRGLMPERS